MSPSNKDQDGGLITACVHTIDLGYLDDPQIGAASFLYEWEHSEAGKYVMENSIEIPYWISDLSPSSMVYEVKIMAKFTPEKYTYYKLKYA